MKRLHFIFITLFLILGQWSSLEHVYHDHTAGEVCDYCLSIKPLEHIAVNSIQPNISKNIPQWQGVLTTQFMMKSSISYFAIRAPPRFI